MAEHSAIEWTNATWNPVTGCDKVSPGCAHCYAETFAERFRGVAGHPYEQGFDLKLWPERLERPLKWRKPRMIFVNSMSDLFHEQVPTEFIARVFAVMGVATQHTFQVLTKRPDRMRDLLSTLAFESKVKLAIGEIPHTAYPTWPLPNVWAGTSIENRRYVARADHLRETPAAVRFISAEPLLGPLFHDQRLRVNYGVVMESTGWADGHQGPELNLERIDWLIAGGESGPGARRCDPDWIRQLRNACHQTGTAFFLKQLGGHPDKRGHEKATLDGCRHLDMPRRQTAMAA